MKGLFLKDFYNIKKGSRGAFFVILIILLFPILVGSKDIFTCLWSFTVFILTYSSLVGNTIFYDMRSGFLGSIPAYPISKKIYIGEKYILNLFIHLFVLLVLFLDLIFFYKTSEYFGFFYALLVLYFIISNINIALYIKFESYAASIIGVGFAFILITFFYRLLDGDFSRINKIFSNDNYILNMGILLVSIFVYVFTKKIATRALEEAVL